MPYIAIAVALAAACIFFLRRRGLFDTRVSSVHPLRKHDGCKFDAAEVRRSFGKRTPKIDLTNIPAPDPRVAKVLAAVSAGDFTKVVKELSGELPATINGAQVKIVSRSSRGAGLSAAVQYLEQFYAGLSKFTVSRDNYTKGGTKLCNVVAEIKGSVSPEKVLIVGAHLDSTAGDTYSNERLAPGADDDASGTAALMAIATALQGLNTGITVRLVHFTGEEQGLWGSYVYSDRAAKAKTDVVAMLQMDMIGYCAKEGNRVDLHDGTEPAGHALVEQMFRNVKRYGLTLSPFDTHNHAVDGRSDHAGFMDHGYTAVCVSEEFTDDGFNPNYHSTGDRIAAMNIPYAIEVIRMMLATVADLAEIQ